MALPLEGTVVVDLTQNGAGPFCTQILGDMGADVVKVERPGRGDDSRAWSPPFWGDESSTFMAVNRNKRSLALNLKHDGALEILKRLVARGDVFVQSLRAGVVEELGPPRLTALADLMGDPVPAHARRVGRVSNTTPVLGHGGPGGLVIARMTRGLSRRSCQSARDKSNRSLEAASGRRPPGRCGQTVSGARRQSPRARREILGDAAGYACGSRTTCLDGSAWGTVPPLHRVRIPRSQRDRARIAETCMAGT